MPLLAETKAARKKTGDSAPAVSTRARRARVTPLASSQPTAVAYRKPSCSCGGGCPRCRVERQYAGTPVIQPKIKPGQSDDDYEQKADEQVMRMSAPRVKGQACEDDDELDRTKGGKRAPPFVTKPQFEPGDPKLCPIECQQSPVPAGCPAPCSPPDLLISGSDPQLGPCGKYHWSTCWDLSHPSLFGGYVIQHITVDYNIRDCDTGKPFRPPNIRNFKKDHWEFWEAWEVRPGEEKCVGVDNYVEGNDDGTWGTAITRGRAQYFEGLTTLPAHFVVGHKDTLNPHGLSTTIDPKLSGGSNIVLHDLGSEHNCCPGRGCQPSPTEKQRETKITHKRP